jgi:hypothetical protein
MPTTGAEFARRTENGPLQAVNASASATGLEPATTGSTVEQIRLSKCLKNQVKTPSFHLQTTSRFYQIFSDFSMDSLDSLPTSLPQWLLIPPSLSDRIG